jgi:iduronate 2-sulfatase
MSRSTVKAPIALVTFILFAGFDATRMNADETKSASKPNVLLICVDDLKPVLGCYGDVFAKTPHIDQLARRGVTFESAYCNQAVCSPSRNALLTSLRPQTLGIYDLPTNFRKSAPDAITLGQHLRQNGYRAEALGKIFHVGHGNDDDKASWDVPLFRAKAKAYALPLESAKRTKPNGEEKGPATEMAEVSDDVYADGQVADEAIRRLEDAAKNSSQPFFIAVGFIRPHLPFVAPKKYWDLYRPEELPLPQVKTPPELAPEYAATNFGELKSYSSIPASGPIDEELTRHLIHGYYAATSYTDAQIGKVLAALRKQGLEEDTLVVLWGDHGWHLGDHGMWCKHTNYEQATRIPVIVAGPSVAQGQKTNAMIESVDIYPTISAVCGLSTPAGLDGTTFKHVLQDPTKRGRESVINVYPRGNRLGRAIRTERYRLVEWKPFSDESVPTEYELYDYQLDPLETKNLASKESKVLAELVSILAKHPAPKPPVKATTQRSQPGKKTDRAAMFRKRDKDDDKQLTFEEFMQSQPDPDAAKLRFPRFDLNGDEVLSPEEFIGKPAAK